MNCGGNRRINGIDHSDSLSLISCIARTGGILLVSYIARAGGSCDGILIAGMMNSSF